MRRVCNKLIKSESKDKIQDFHSVP